MRQSCRRVRSVAMVLSVTRAMRVASLGLVAGLVLTSSSSAAPRSGKIAFLSDRDYTARIYVMDPDGGLATPLTKGRFAQGLSWSPDGRRLVSSDFEGAFTIASDGSDRRVLLAARGMAFQSFSWSPVGSTIAFSGRCSAFQPCSLPAAGQIQFIKSDGADAHGISGVRSDSEDSISPSWSRDGTRIAFARFAPQYGAGSNVWVMNADGSGQRMLTAGGEPAWSPDGDWIAFTRVVRRNLDIFVYAIFLVHPDGSGLHRLTSSGHGSDHSPAWSPDARRLLYSHQVFGGFGGWSEIHVIRSDGRGDRDLTPNSSANGWPAWQPVTGAVPPAARVIPAVLAPPTRPAGHRAVARRSAARGLPPDTRSLRRHGEADRRRPAPGAQSPRRKHPLQDPRRPARQCGPRSDSRDPQALPSGPEDRPPRTGSAHSSALPRHHIRTEDLPANKEVAPRGLRFSSGS